MKKIFFTLMLCGLILVAGCDKTQYKQNQIPKSVKIYRELSFTDEQNKQIAEIRNTERAKMEAIRKELSAKREELINLEKNSKLTDEQRQANHVKYRELTEATRVKLDEERTNYDNSVMAILTDEQKAIYKRYMEQRSKEKVERIKNIQKEMSKK